MRRVGRHVTLAALAAAALALTTGCASGDPAWRALSGGADPLGSWALESIVVDGEALAIPDHLEGTLTVTAEGRFGGTFCNRYGGELLGPRGTFEADSIFSTAMACTEGGIVESTYIDALRDNTAVHRPSADALILRSEPLDTVLTFHATPAPGVAELSGDWVLGLLLVDGISTPLPEDDPLTLSVDPATEDPRWFRADGPCNYFSSTLQGPPGTFEVSDQAIISAVGCDLAAHELDGVYFDALGSVTGASNPDDTRLVLVSAATGVELHFVRDTSGSWESPPHPNPGTPSPV